MKFQNELSNIFPFGLYYMTRKPLLQMNWKFKVNNGVLVKEKKQCNYFSSIIQIFLNLIFIRNGSENKPSTGKVCLTNNVSMDKPSLQVSQQKHWSSKSFRPNVIEELILNWCELFWDNVILPQTLLPITSSKLFTQQQIPALHLPIVLVSSKKYRKKTFILFCFVLFYGKQKMYLQFFVCCSKSSYI